MAPLETSHGAPRAVPPTACCTTVDSMPHHLRVQALEAASRRAGVARRARTRTSCRTSACETKRRWPPPRCNSGCVARLRLGLPLFAAARAQLALCHGGQHAAPHRGRSYRLAAVGMGLGCGRHIPAAAARSWWFLQRQVVHRKLLGFSDFYRHRCSMHASLPPCFGRPARICNCPYLPVPS